MAVFLENVMNFTCPLGAEQGQNQLLHVNAWHRLVQLLSDFVVRHDKGVVGPALIALLQWVFAGLLERHVDLLANNHPYLEQVLFNLSVAPTNEKNQQLVKKDNH